VFGCEAAMVHEKEVKESTGITQQVAATERSASPDCLFGEYLLRLMPSAGECRALSG